MGKPRKERVSDKIASIRAFCKEFEGATKETNKAIEEGPAKIQSEVQGLVKENEEAARKIDEGVKKLSGEIENYVRDFW